MKTVKTAKTMKTKKTNLEIEKVETEVVIRVGTMEIMVKVLVQKGLMHPITEQKVSYNKPFQLNPEINTTNNINLI